MYLWLRLTICTAVSTVTVLIIEHFTTTIFIYHTLYNNEYQYKDYEIHQ